MQHSAILKPRAVFPGILLWWTALRWGPCLVPGVLFHSGQVAFSGPEWNSPAKRKAAWGNLYVPCKPDVAPCTPLCFCQKEEHPVLPSIHTFVANCFLTWYLAIPQLPISWDVSTKWDNDISGCWFLQMGCRGDDLGWSWCQSITKSLHCNVVFKNIACFFLLEINHHYIHFY